MFDSVRVNAGKESRDIVTVYGDPDGLRWLADVLIAVAKCDQLRIPDDNLPPNEGFHLHLRPQTDCHPASKEAVVGRLDAKNGGSFSWYLSSGGSEGL